jgi:4-amino-4-deoxy-L-arabinose transferase-like glycosyltransferase
MSVLEQHIYLILNSWIMQTKRFYQFLATLTLMRIIYAMFLPLAPQEAYYWNYSRHLALSYFDHPPMAAYFIRLATLLGTSAFSIHLAAILLSIPLSIAIYKLGSLLFDEWVGFWSAVVINLTFIYALGALIITPDTPMLLFWTLVMISCLMIDLGKGKFWWILLGIFIGAGFDSKYPIVFAGLGAFLFFMSSKNRVKHFATIWPYLSLISAFIIVLPVIYWNYSHNWASFAFQTSRRAGEMTRFRPDMFLGYIGTIFAIYGFIPIPLLLKGIWNSLKEALKSKLTNHILIVAFSIPLVIFLVPVSLRSWVKMNWTTPAFIGWFIAAVAYYQKYCESKSWVQIYGKITLAFILIAMIAVHVVVLMPNIYFGRGDYYAGWKELAHKIESIRSEMPGPYVIAGSEYKISSELAFYLKDHPETLGNNIIGQNGLQYDYWSNPDTLLGYNAIYVYDGSPKGSTFETELARFFKRVDTAIDLRIEKGGKLVRTYYIYRCFNYIGIPKGE